MPELEGFVEKMGPGLKEWLEIWEGKEKNFLN